MATGAAARKLSGWPRREGEEIADVVQCGVRIADFILEDLIEDFSDISG
jgi:hypothetical protein